MDAQLTFGMKKVTKIGFWNIRTMNETGKLKQIVKEMERYQLDILGLSEIRWKEFGMFKTNSEHLLLYSGVSDENIHRDGVGLLMTKACHNCLIDWHPISERIMTARFKAKIRNISIIQCYAPTENSELRKKTEFYNSLKDTIKQISQKDIVILMGDLNAKVGDNNEGVEHIVGMHGIGERNDNGNMFTEFCADHDLIIGGTWFPHKHHHKVTWVSPDKQTENQIDHFAIKRSWRKSLLDVRSKRGADVGSDHHLVVAQLRIKILAAKRKFETRRKNFDTRKIKERIVKDKIKLELRNKFQVLMEQETENTGNIETSWNEIKEGLLKISEQTLGYKHKRKKRLDYNRDLGSY